MKLKTSLLALAVSLSCAAVWAQDSKPAAAGTSDERPPEFYPNPNLPPQKIFYKWQARGKTYYGKYVPRGVTSYTKINEQGMLVSDRPTSDSITVLRPVRPQDATANPQQAGNDNQPLPPGSITREQRCADAQQTLQTIQTKSNIVEDDGKGNLIALSSEQVADRKRQAEGIVERLCKPLPVVGSVSSVKGAPPKGAPTTVYGPASMPPAVEPVNIPPAVPPAQPILPATAVPPPQPQQAPSAPGAEEMSTKAQAGG